MENFNNVGSTANYDGFGTGANGVDNTKNDLTPEFYEQKENKAPVEEQPGANVEAVAEDLNRVNADRGETAIAASEAREEALNTSFDEKAKLQEAHEKDPSNEKVVAYLKQVNEYINKLISEFDNPPENTNTISSTEADSLTAAQPTIDAKPGAVESAESDREAQQNDDLAYLGKDNFLYSKPQDAIDSFAS